MANELIDLGFMAAKVAALQNDYAKMAVDGVSLAYNAVQIANYKAMITDYTQMLSVLSFSVQRKGYVTEQESQLAQACNNGIQQCQAQVLKHGIIAATDVASLIFGAINQVKTSKNQ